MRPGLLPVDDQLSDKHAGTKDEVKRREEGSALAAPQKDKKVFLPLLHIFTAFCHKAKQFRLLPAQITRGRPERRVQNSGSETRPHRETHPSLCRVGGGLARGGGVNPGRLAPRRAERR